MLNVTPQAAAPEPVMLVIGDVGRWNAEGRDTPTLENCHFASVDDLDSALLDRLRPDFVISALIGAGVDAIEIAERLTGLSYGGAYRAIVGQSIPNTGVIRSEIKAVAPDLDFDIFIVQRQDD